MGENVPKHTSRGIHNRIGLAFVLLGIMVILLAIFAGEVLSWLWVLVWVACFLASAYFFKTPRSAG